MSSRIVVSWASLGLRTSPRSPPVQVTTRTRTPSSTYRAMVAAPLLDSSSGCACTAMSRNDSLTLSPPLGPPPILARPRPLGQRDSLSRSEEHTSELQSRGHLVCRLLLEKKNTYERL